MRFAFRAAAHLRIRTDLLRPRPGGFLALCLLPTSS
jgi:hypothetical protein